MSSDALYSKKDTDRLEKYSNVLDTLVDKLEVLVTDDLKSKDARKVRVLLETIQTSTESIHKGAANKAKAEANNNDNDIKKLIAQSIQQLNASKSREPILTDEDRNIMFDSIETPVDVVAGETETSVGYLSMEDIIKPKED